MTMTITHKAETYTTTGTLRFYGTYGTTSEIKSLSAKSSGVWSKPLLSMIDSVPFLSPGFVDDRSSHLAPMIPSAKPRKAGSARSQIKMSADFDAPLSDFDEYMG